MWLCSLTHTCLLSCKVLCFPKVFHGALIEWCLVIKRNKEFVNQKGLNAELNNRCADLIIVDLLKCLVSIIQEETWEHSLYIQLNSFIVKLVFLRKHSLEKHSFSTLILFLFVPVLYFKMLKNEVQTWLIRKPLMHL